MPLPDFLVIGAAKCGTTSLAAYLSAHDRIYMARPKEIKYFSHYWERGLDWYASQFEDAPPTAEMVGEASPQYTMSPLRGGIPDRIASVLPDVKLVYLVRDPIDQIRSFYRHRVYLGKEKAPNLDQAIRENTRYISVASYGFQVSEYLERFPADQLLIIDNEDLLHQRFATLDTVLTFLNVGGRIADDRLDLELNRGREDFSHPRFVTALRSVWRAGQPVTGKLPPSFRGFLRSALAKPQDSRTFEITPGTMRWLRAKLEPELEALLEYARGRLDQAVPVWLDRLRT